ncbi:hypothetical protein EDD16DRAFT_1520737 [Pisolithus croceorrhizus]|nr:hypothetical protein EDD16DRAFT_1520737 [Pisolithus croceorrhizus]
MRVTTAATSAIGLVVMGQALTGRLLNMQPFSIPSLPLLHNNSLLIPRLPRHPPLAVVHSRRASPASIDQELDELERGVMLCFAPVPSISSLEFSLRAFSILALVVLTVSVVGFLIGLHIIVKRWSSGIYLW